MKTVVILTCHNQSDTIKTALKILARQTTPPDGILITDDDSDFGEKSSIIKYWCEVVKEEDCHALPVPHLAWVDKSMATEQHPIYPKLTDTGKGRCATRNRAIEYILKINKVPSLHDECYELLIFIDGDSVPQSYDFIEQYQMAVSKGQRGRHDNLQAFFGMRQHIFRPTDMKDFNFDFTYESVPIKYLPSDLLTVNMGKLGEPIETMDMTDLRIVSGAVDNFNKTKDVMTKLAYLTTGLLTWSCNFAITREAIVALAEFREKYFNSTDYFDTKAFKNLWGGEDNIFGFDLLGAGVDIKLIDTANTYHFMHDRSSFNLFDYMREIPIRQERYYMIRQILEGKYEVKKDPRDEERLRRELHDIISDIED